MEKKPKRTGAIIGTIVAILLCGCPGLSLCVVGIWAATGTLPDYWLGYGSNLPGWVGFALLCVALIFIAIAVVVPITDSCARRRRTPKLLRWTSCPHKNPSHRLHNHSKTQIAALFSERRNLLKVLSSVFYSLFSVLTSYRSTVPILPASPACLPPHSPQPGRRRTGSRPRTRIPPPVPGHASAAQHGSRTTSG